MPDSTEKRVWGIHTADDTLFLEGGVIAIGWGALGDIGKFGNNRDTYARYMSPLKTSTKAKQASLLRLLAAMRLLSGINRRLF